MVIIMDGGLPMVRSKFGFVVDDGGGGGEDLELWASTRHQFKYYRKLQRSARVVVAFMGWVGGGGRDTHTHTRSSYVNTILCCVCVLVRRWVGVLCVAYPYQVSIQRNTLLTTIVASLLFSSFWFQGEVVTRDGYSNMVFFPEDFPWKNKSLKEMLGPKFLKVRRRFRV